MRKRQVSEGDRWLWDNASADKRSSGSELGRRDGGGGGETKVAVIPPSWSGKARGRSDGGGCCSVPAANRGAIKGGGRWERTGELQGLKPALGDISNEAERVQSKL